MTNQEPQLSSNSGFALWFTGRPAAGKSTLAEAVALQLRQNGVAVEILDSDQLRTVLTPNPTYEEGERDWFYAVMVHIGQLLTKHGVNVLFAATATRRSYRDTARKAIPRFAEVYVQCSLETVKARDPKQIYALAAAGKVSRVPGLDIPYEAPLDPALAINTETASTNEGAAAVMAFLQPWLGQCEPLKP